jgi:hypothetical protein
MYFDALALTTKHKDTKEAAGKIPFVSWCLGGSISHSQP